MSKNEHNALSDEALMERSKDGDTQAFAMLYDRYSGKMLNYFARMLWNDREKAADLSHDLFAKIIKKPELYRSGSRFSTWVYSIANNMCKNEYRHHEVQERHADGIMLSHGNRVTHNEAKIDLKEFKQALDVRLSDLDHPQRSTFIMRYKQGLSIKEIADVMECSEGTVKSRLFYTAKKLAKDLSRFDPNKT